MMRALKHGVHEALAHWPSALLLYLAVAVPAVLVGYVFQSSFVSAFGRSSSLDALSEGFAYTTLFDLFTREGFRITPVVTVSLGFLVISLPLHSFLTAGLIGAIREDASWSAHSFFAGASRHTGGFILLTLLALALVLLIAVLTLSAAAFLFNETEDISSPGVLVLLALGVTLCAGIMTLSDFARICLVHDPERGVPGSIRAAAEFLFRHAGGAAALALVLAVASLLPLIGVFLFEDLVPPAVGGWLVPLVAIQQAAVMLRSWVRVFAFAAQASFMRNAQGTFRPGELPSTPSSFLTQGI